MTKNVILPNPEKLAKLKEKISEDGADKIHVLSDFDRTLTTAFVDGKSMPSIISILRDGNYLTPDYAPKAHALYNKYHPIEIDPDISFAEKKKAMHEWWMKAFDLLTKSGFTRDDLEKVVESGKIRFRKGASEFIDLLYAHNVPLIIMSSAGLGEAISMLFKKEGRLYENVYIISNSFEWDKNGNVIGIKQPVIHALNKDETAIQDYPVFEIIKNRKNVVLLGDSLGDIGMITGFDYDNLIKIGFLNEEVEKCLEEYKNNYDIVILNDADMNFVNKLFKDLCS